MNSGDDTSGAGSPSTGWVRIDLNADDVKAAFHEMRVTFKPGTPEWDEHQRWLKQLAERYGVHSEQVRLYLTWPSNTRQDGSAYFMVPPAT